MIHILTKMCSLRNIKGTPILPTVLLLVIDLEARKVDIFRLEKRSHAN
jgi:hypothetical protein